MLVSVSERTREIGLRKALGATNRSILLQFFLEGAFLTLMSGGIGMAGAALFMHLFSGLPAPEGFDPPTCRSVGVSGHRNAGAGRDRRRTVSGAQGGHAAAGRSPEAGVAMVNDLLSQAYEAMRYNRRRTAFTMLGMAWGIATVVLLLAYGSGFRPRHRGHLRQLGHAHHRRLSRAHLAAGGRAKSRHPDQFTIDDIDRIVNAAPLVRPHHPGGRQAGHGAAGRTHLHLAHRGLLSQHVQDPGHEDRRRPLLRIEDEARAARVAVIGSEAKTKLFSGGYALGQYIRVDGISFKVIGIMQPRMQEGDDSINKMIYVPFTTMSDLKNTHYLDGIWLDYEGDQFEQVERQVRQVLADQYNFKPDDNRAVFVFNMMKQLHQFQIITMGLKVLLGFIGTLTLGIGGVGLMNIMLVSVTQRTREIGVEKALGGRRRDILFQFLAEALTITFIGGIAGIAIAYLISFSVGRITFYSAVAKNAEAADIRLIIDPTIVFVATMILSPGWADQRNVAGDQGLAAGSDRGVALRVAALPRLQSGGDD